MVTSTMRRIVVALFLLLGLPVFSQTGMVTVSGSNMTDRGNPISNATITFAPVSNSGTPISYRISGKGQSTFRPSSAQITAGVFTISLPDTNLTQPQNVCFKATVIDNASGNSLFGPGYQCVQPAYGNSWCTAGVCNFDIYNPNLAPLVVVQTGPAGQITGVTAEALSSGSNPTVQNMGTSTNAVFHFGIPVGPQGAQGPPGAGNPAGNNTACQLNDNGIFGGDPLACSINKTTHAITLGDTTPNSVSPTNRAYKNRGDMIDAVADCGAVGDGTTDNQSAIAACLTANPYVNIFFPPRTASGSAQAVYYHSGTWVLAGHQMIESTGSAYANALGAVLKSPVGVNGIDITGTGVQVNHINIVGSEPASQNTTDVANLILPSGAILQEFQSPISAVTASGGTLTLAIGSQDYSQSGIVTISGLPSPFTGLNGFAYRIINQCANIHASCQILNTGWITINVPGFPDTARTTVASGTVFPGTTGTSSSVGIKVEQSFAQLDDVYVANFGHNCVENNGTVVADDLRMTNVLMSGCRVSGYLAHGGDTNADLHTGELYYGNQIFGKMDNTFLHGTANTDQFSYNYAGATGWGTTPGTPFTIASITRDSSNVLDIVTTASNTLLQGQGILITGVTDTTFNNDTIVAGVATAASCFVSVIVGPTELKCQQPQNSTVLTAVSSSGGTVQLASQRQIFFGSSLWGGHFWVDGANDSSNMVLINPYGEGMGSTGKDKGCSYYMGGGTILINSHFGDAVCPGSYPGLWLQAGSSGAFISPFSANAFGLTYSTQFLVHKGYRPSSDTNDYWAISDVLGGSTAVANGMEFRCTHCGFNDSWNGFSTATASDATNKANYPFLVSYGSTLESGETSSIGTPVFVGTGLNDLTASGTLTTTLPTSFIVKICATGTPDSFTWQIGTTGTVSACTAMTGSAQALSGGLSITFAATTGHTVADQWTIPLTITMGTRPVGWFPNGFYNGAGTSTALKCLMTAATAQPTSGAYNKCDFVRNILPTTNGIFGWECTITGNPCGAWSTFYLDSSLNGLMGAVTLAQGPGINLAQTGNTITVSATASTSGSNTPSWLRYLGDGNEGAYSCTLTTCVLGQEHWFSSFTVTSGSIVHNNTGAPLVVRVTGACNIAGAVSSSVNTGGAFGGGTNGGAGGGIGGGGSGGTAAGTASTIWNTAFGSAGSPGSAGAASGGNAGNGGALVASVEDALISTGFGGTSTGTTVTVYSGGTAGGAGGSSGGAGGKAGGAVIFSCGSWNFTGTIDVSGGAGIASPGNNSGAGGGGGGGLFLAAYQSLAANTGTVNAAGGAGGSCGSFTGCGTAGNGSAGVAKQYLVQ